MSLLTYGTVCLVQFEISTAVWTLLNPNLKLAFLNKLLLTVHASHMVITAPTNSLMLHMARYKFYLFTYLFIFNYVH